MDLLKYEFMENPEGSYNAFIGDLVKDIRHYRNDVPGEEFKRAMPAMQKLEKKLQQLDAEWGQPKRDYIQEIMDELDIEGSVEEKVMDEIKRAAGSIVNGLFEKDFLMEELDFSFNKIANFSWIIFQGYKAREIEKDAPLIVIKEIFRASCYKYNIIFIDNCPF